MDDFKNKPEPKKIKMPPLVDRSCTSDTMESTESDWNYRKLLETLKNNENNSKNNSESI